MLARRLGRLDPKTIEWLRRGRRDRPRLRRDAAGAARRARRGAASWRRSRRRWRPGSLLESTAEPGRYSFSHALIREALYEGMSAQRRARVHRRVGEALEAAGEASPRALAHHFTRAADPADAGEGDHLRLARGCGGDEMLAHEEAAEHYARALEVLTRFEPDADARRGELLLLVGEASVRSGEALAGPRRVQGGGRDRRASRRRGAPRASRGRRLAAVRPAARRGRRPS